MSSERECFELLDRRELAALEFVASREYRRTASVTFAVMVAHARIRRGQFRSALPILRELERRAPERREFVVEIAAMCEREMEQRAAHKSSAWSVAANVFAFAFGLARGTGDTEPADPWSGHNTTLPVGGRALLANGETFDFDDIQDADDPTGRRLLVFGFSRAWKIPFSVISSFELYPVRGPLGFDDLWSPLELQLTPPLQVPNVRGRVPCLYLGSLEHKDRETADGLITHFDYSCRDRRGLGQRDYALSHGSTFTLVGVRQLRRVVFCREVRTAPT